MNGEMGETVGTVAALSRFPVKSMQGERLPTAELTRSGVVGDRAYALVEIETGKVVSRKTPPGRVDVRAIPQVPRPA